MPVGGGVSKDDPSYLLTQPAGTAAKRRALLVLAVSTALFAALAPFAKLKLAPLPALIPIYQTALVVTDTITAVLLFGQFRIFQARALMVLATGYVFSALMTIAHALTFPGLFSATGLLGATPQSTAWIYMFWHAGFPLFVLAYASSKSASGATATKSFTTIAVPAATVMAAAALTTLATAGAPWLPQIMQGNRYTSAMLATVTSVWAFSMAALVCLWRARPHSFGQFEGNRQRFPR